MSRYKGRSSKRSIAAAHPHQVVLCVNTGIGTLFWPMLDKLRKIAGDQHADWSELKGLDAYTVHGFKDPAHAAAFRGWIAEQRPELLDLTPTPAPVHSGYVGGRSH